MIYLESGRFDFNEVSERREEFMQFLMDDRRYINKSIKRLIELDQIDIRLFERVKKCIANTLLATPKDLNEIEIDPDNDNPEYLQDIEKQKAEINILNEKMDKLKKKIKITCVKGEVLKNKRNNMSGFLTIYPNKDIKKEFNIIDFTEEKKEPKEKLKPGNSEEVTPSQESNKVNEIDEGNEGNEDNEGNEVNEGNEGNVVNEDKEVNENVVDTAIEKVENTSVIEQPKNQPKEEVILEKQNGMFILKLVEPIVTIFDYLNEATLFKNAALSTDVYIIHNDITDYFKLTILKAIYFTLKKFGIRINLRDSFEKIKSEYNRLADLLKNDIMHNENYHGGRLINIDIMPEVAKSEESNENLK
jgi:hypothetical protein